MTFKLSIPQSKIWSAYQHYRFLCVCAGRRGGKTTIGEVLICRAASIPNQTVWYVAPTYRMAKRLMWRRLKKAIDKKLIANKNEAELSIELVNGSLIQLFGADNPDGLVGEGVNACFLDEVALMSNLEQIFERSIRPALADKQGSAILLTTPRGFNYFYTLCSRAWNFPYPRTERVEGNDKWWFYSFTTIEGGNVTAEELADMAATMPKKLYDQEVNAQFTTPANRVYDNYDFAANELDDEEAKLAAMQRQLLIGIDFNVNPMNAVIAVAIKDECHVIDSIEVMSSNTDELCQEIKNRYPNHTYMAFPDPSGKARKTSAPVGITDFVILERNGFTVYAPNKAPMIVDRVNAVQAMLCSADGKRRLLVHKRAKTLIRALNGQCYKEGTSIPEKGGVPDLSGACFAAGTLIDTSVGILPIEKLPKSGMVKTFDGSYQPYHSNELKGFSRTVQVILSNGKIITCTPNHLFLTTEGWIEAVNLTGKLLCKTQSSYQKQSKVLTKKEIALFVIQNLKLRKNLPTLNAAEETVEVLCVGEGLNQQVYCLTVPDWGCFAIEGDLVVSNCDSLGYLIWGRWNLFTQKNKNPDERIY